MYVLVWFLSLYALLTVERHRPPFLNPLSPPPGFPPMFFAAAAGHDTDRPPNEKKGGGDTDGGNLAITIQGRN